MRILVLTSTYPRWPHDSEPSFVHQLCQRLAHNGIEVEVLAPHFPGAACEEQLDGIQIIRYRYCIEKWQTLTGSGGITARLREKPSRALLMPLLVGALGVAMWRRLRIRRYTLVHAHWLVPQALVAAIVLRFGTQRRIPLLCTSHGGDIFALRGPIWRRLRQWTIGRTDHTAVVSEYMREVLIAEGTDPQLLSVASMGVELRQYAPVACVERVPNRIIFVGRLVEKKGVRFLLEALALVTKAGHRAELLVIGDGPERQPLEALAARLGIAPCVDFRGALPPAALPSLYSSAAIAVVPSIVDKLGDQEGLGLVTIEAIGCGCAVVASDLPAIREVIDDRCTGLLSPPGEAQPLAKRLIALMESPELRQKLSSAASEAIRSRYGWDVRAKAYSDLIYRITSLAPPGPPD